MIRSWQSDVLARETARVAEHQPDAHSWCRGCMAVGHVEEWPCATVGAAVLAVEQLKSALALPRRNRT